LRACRVKERERKILIVWELSAIPVSKVKYQELEVTIQVK